MFNLESGRKECFPYGYYNSSRIPNIRDSIATIKQAALENMDEANHETFLKRLKDVSTCEPIIKNALVYMTMSEQNVFLDRIKDVVTYNGNINEALKYIPQGDHDAFIDNVKAIAYINNETFDMKQYCVFYCQQDVTILREGFEWFRRSLQDEFALDVHNFVSISSIANRYMEQHCYWPNGNLYDLSNTPREFISRCIIGGRCMLSDNEPQRTSNEPVVDFDAVSLYPSAIHRLYTLEGMPKVMTHEMLKQQYLLDHLFGDDQKEPSSDRHISGFFIEAKIESVGNNLHFPLIVWDPKSNHDVEHERATNEPCTMYMDHITFEDLIKFHHATIKPIRGYYYDGNRDHKIRDVIEELFELRLRYKRERNPLQVIIKLLLNSVYGKTILKPIDTETKFVLKYDKERYLHNRYHYVKELSGSDMQKFMIATEYKPYSKHFTFVPLGVNILSMSKRIMSEVMCTAESLGIPIFYTDTDSFHLYQRDLPILEQHFETTYQRKLIGSRLGQFHSDFALVNDHPKMPIATESIFVMKKTYIDKLVNEDGDVAFHCRMKGVPLDVIVNRANELFDGVPCYVRDGLVYPKCNTCDDVDNDDQYSILQLYRSLYDGDEITFDLAIGGRPCFDLSNFEVKTKDTFVRNVRASAQGPPGSVRRST